ncbi:MAG: L-lactate permease (modular protein) [Arenicellales bacterium IbO2]|nr:L-lactate permease [Gammaproteobacteria bacterium]MDA7995475.1 L-lactate permease [Gammaproteobacteria bacterium]CAJ2375989.1 MAG: L-lactate permease (modular protein) [Arenicellales bacterium IbO2]
MNALLPLAALLAALVCKRGAFASSLIGIAAALAVMHFDRRYALAFSAEDLRAVLILTLSAALVIVPGQIFNALLQSAHVISAIGAKVRAASGSRVKTASLIVFGAAPALESLTGFGVSLFFTVPLLLQLFPAGRALLLSLLGMNIMPWGTLGLSTLIGAQIAGLDFKQLSMMTAATSFAVFPVIGALVALVCRADCRERFDFLYPPLAGLMLACALLVSARYAAPELAGVFAGAATALILSAARLRALKFRMPQLAQWAQLLAPYLTLVALVGASRIPPLHDALQRALRWEGGGIALPVLASPGVTLLISALLFCAFSTQLRARREMFQLFQLGITRSLRPVGGIFLFVLFAQLHRAGGLFAGIAERAADLQRAEIALAAPLLGMFGGFATGSNVGGNALFMPLQAEIGARFAQEPVFAALQNSASGHAVFLSLPIILLALSIAGDDARARQTWLARRALLCAPPVYAALAAPFYFRFA